MAATSNRASAGATVRKSGGGRNPSAAGGGEHDEPRPDRLGDEVGGDLPVPRDAVRRVVGLPRRGRRGETARPPSFLLRSGSGPRQSGDSPGARGGLLGPEVVPNPARRASGEERRLLGLDVEELGSRSLLGLADRDALGREGPRDFRGRVVEVAGEDRVHGTDDDAGGARGRRPCGARRSGTWRPCRSRGRCGSRRRARLQAGLAADAGVRVEIPRCRRIAGTSPWSDRSGRREASRSGCTASPGRSAAGVQGRFPSRRT